MKLIDKYKQAERDLKDAKDKLKVEWVAKNKKIKFAANIYDDPQIQITKYEWERPNCLTISSAGYGQKKGKYQWVSKEVYVIDSEDWGQIRALVDKLLNLEAK